MSQFCYLTHWRMVSTKKPPPTEPTKSKAVRKFICFLTSPRSIQNVSTINQNRG